MERTNPVVLVSDVSNQVFLESQARAGRVGLVGGTTLIEKAIRRAERHLHAEKEWSLWSHAFLFQGKRLDGQEWVIESDLQLKNKHIRLGVQENRLSKYYNETLCPNLAVLDFELSEEQVNVLLREALEMVASRAIYSIRELFGTLIALRHQKLRPHRNLLAREKSCYCSGFIQHLFQRAGIDLAPGVHSSHNTPEDISRTVVPHTTYRLERKIG